MRYNYLRQEEQDDAVAEALLEREREHFNYELNIQNYDNILAGLAQLPEAWPDDLLKFKSLHGDALAVAVPADKLQLVVDLQFRDRLQVLKNTAVMEQGKVERVYKALQNRIADKDRERSAIQRIRTKTNV